MGGRDISVRAEWDMGKTRCVMDIIPLIYTQKDMCEGVERACARGFTVHPYPAVPNNTPLRLKRLHESEFVNYNRQSSIEVLKNTPLRNGGTDLIFAEADFRVHITAAGLKHIVDQAPLDWDILSFNTNTEVKSEEEYPDNLYVRWVKTPHHTGNHALMFKNRSVVNRVIKLWEEEPDFSDQALNLGGFNIYTSHQYLFTQDHYADYENQALPCDKRFLVCCTSYRRVKDAVRQIYTFMDQSYTNFIFQLFLRGVSEYEWKTHLAPQFQHFIRDGRLVVTCVPNDNMCANVSQFGDGISPEAYDLILKVDDDDWYDRDYLLRLNSIHRSFPASVGSFTTQVNGFFSQCAGYPIFDPGKVTSFGGHLLVLTKQTLGVMKEYVHREYDSEVIAPYIGDDEKPTTSWGWREDNLLHRIQRRMGLIYRDYMDSGAPGLLYTVLSPSVTRRQSGYTAFSYEELLRVREPKSKDEWYVIIRRHEVYSLSDRGLETWGEVVAKEKGSYIIRIGQEKKYLILRRDEVTGIWNIE